jgi:glutamyl-tRNA reductase
MIVGEREIITQVRKSYDDCRKYNLTGDKIRLLIRFTIESAKRIYTETNIADRPVSVVSLAYHTMRKKDIPLDARIIVIGAGVTNTNMLRFLKKHGFRNFAIFNRSLDKAEKLANDVGGVAFPLDELTKYNKGFDLVITCTGAEDHIITPSIYDHLLNGEKEAKTVIDIAIPHDLHPEVVKQYPVDHISVDFLQEISRKNLRERTKEIIKVDQIIAESTLVFRSMSKEREVELAMREIPNKVKEIKRNALEHVFAKDLDNLDPEAKEKLNEIIDYLEKKYISVPMIMAKKILLEK